MYLFSDPVTYYILYVTVFGKTDLLVRKSIIVYAWKLLFEPNDANGIRKSLVLKDGASD